MYGIGILQILYRRKLLKIKLNSKPILFLDKETSGPEISSRRLTYLLGNPLVVTQLLREEREQDPSSRARARHSPPAPAPIKLTTQERNSLNNLTL